MNDQQTLPDIRHSVLHLIEYRDNMMYLQAGLRLNQSVSQVAEKKLLLVERESKREITFPFKSIESVNDLSLLEAGIDLSLFGKTTEAEKWDLYISVELDDNRRRFRLIGNDDHLEWLFFYDRASDILVVPYTTNKGNVSFDVSEISAIAKAEDISINKEGVLSLSGYAFDPTRGVVNESNMKKKLVFRDQENEFETKFDIEAVNLTPRSLDKQIGFHINVDLKNNEFPADIGALNLFVEIESEGKIIESPPLQLFLDQENKFSQRKVLKSKNGIRKFILKGRKNRELSLTILSYGLTDILKRRWSHLRNGSTVKKIYKHAFKTLGFRAQRNLVIFESFHGKQFSDNPRAIYEYLQQHHPEFKLVWSVDKRHTHLFDGTNIQYTKRFSLKWVFLMARARYWVINVRMPLWLPKPKHTIYLQTWHGTPLKRLAADIEEVHMPGTDTEKYKKNFRKEARKWDYLISPNAYSSIIFWRAFQFDGTIIESGYPRNDYLYTDNHQETIHRLKAKCQIPLDKKVILYAPTWRDDQFYEKGRYKFDLALDLQLMREQLGQEYVILLRMHYLVAENLDLTEFEGFAYDFSDYEDIRDLYLISDLLITDYSSVFFDYANLRRPIIFYVYDIDEYRDKLRGFYFDIEHRAPGPLVKTTEGVIEAVQEAEAGGFSVPPSFEAFYERFCYLEDGHATERVVQEVFLNDHEEESES